MLMKYYAMIKNEGYKIQVSFKFAIKYIRFQTEIICKLVKKEQTTEKQTQDIKNKL